MTVIPFDRIEATKERINLGAIIAAIFISVPLVLGWSAAKIWGFLAWFVAAIVTGWEMGRKLDDSTRKG